MADQQNRGGQQQGTTNPASPNQNADVGADRAYTHDNAGHRRDRDTDRDRQNRDDPSRAPESGDRK